VYNQHDGNTVRERERDREARGKDEKESASGSERNKSPGRGCSKPGLDKTASINSNKDFGLGVRDRENSTAGGTTFGMPPQNKPLLQRHDTVGSTGTASTKKKNRVLKRL